MPEDEAFMAALLAKAAVTIKGVGKPPDDTVTEAEPLLSDETVWVAVVGNPPTEKVTPALIAALSRYMLIGTPDMPVPVLSSTKNVTCD